MVVYGALSEQGPTNIDPLLMIGRSYKIQGWILGQYIASKGLMIVSTIGKINALMANKTLQSKVQKRFTLSQFKENVGDYYKNMTGGKFILCPNFADE